MPLGAAHVERSLAKKAYATAHKRQKSIKMAPGEIALGAGEPYTWDESVQVPLQVQQIWNEVAVGIDKSQTGESNI